MPQPSPQAASPRPRPVLRLAVETVTVDATGWGALLETFDAPVGELSFDYGGQRVVAQDPSDRFLRAGPRGMEVVRRDATAEASARRLLEGFGAVELECMEDVAVPPESRATYLLRRDGDVHDFCAFGAFIVPQLRRQGWRVELAPTYPYRVVEGELDWVAEVDPQERKTDWFGLQLGVDLDDRRVNLLPALVGLLEDAEGATFGSLANRARPLALPLPDGRFLPIPAERVRGLLRVLGELYDGSRVECEALRLTRLSAGALERLDEVFRKSGGRVRWRDPARLREAGRALAGRTLAGRALAGEGRGAVRLEQPPSLRATLRSYQREGVEWLQHLREHEVGGVLADDMGLGKTLQCIAHIVLERGAGRLGPGRPALVISPTSLVGNWRREIGKFAPHLRVLELTGPRRHGRYADIPSHDVVLSSYPILVRDGERLAGQPFPLLILDEAHTIKNTRSQAHRAAKGLDAEQRICVTGTPVENHLGELWALFDFLNPGLLGDELSFRRWYRVPIEQQGDEDRMASLRQLLAPYVLRRLKQEVATELPPKTELLRPLNLSGAQADLYENIRLAAHADVRRLIEKKGLAGSTIPILDALTKLRQVCCDPRLLPLRAARGVDRSAKTEALYELVEHQLGGGHRILVFSQFTRMLELLRRGLVDRGIDPLMLTGQSKHRSQLVDRFEAGEADVFLISLKAGGVGLTLTGADTVLHYDPWWNPAAQDQATDRAYRIGQTKPVFAHSLFIAGSVEERMLGLQQRKRRLAQGILGDATGGTALTEDDVEELFAPLTA